MVVEALQNLGIVAIGTGAAGLVARYGIDQVSNVVERGIDQFFDEELARYRAELEDERVVFSRLHEERASVVVELYERFVLFERDMCALTTGQTSDPPSDELLQKATTSGNEFAEFYAVNEIYLPSDTCEAVERLQDEMTDVFAEFRTGRTHGDRRDRRPALERYQASWRDVTEDEVPELKRELQRHCRDLLGVDLDGERVAERES